MFLRNRKNEKETEAGQENCAYEIKNEIENETENVSENENRRDILEK